MTPAHRSTPVDLRSRPRLVVPAAPYVLEADSQLELQRRSDPVRRLQGGTYPAGLQPRDRRLGRPDPSAELPEPADLLAQVQRPPGAPVAGVGRRRGEPATADLLPPLGGRLGLAPGDAGSSPLDRHVPPRVPPVRWVRRCWRRAARARAAFQERGPHPRPTEARCRRTTPGTQRPSRNRGRS